MNSQGGYQMIVRHTVPLISYQINDQNIERRHEDQDQHTRRTMESPSTDRNPGYGHLTHQSTSRNSTANLPSPWGNHATDCTGHDRSIVFLHTPSCVQIFIARGSLVMIRLPLGDLNKGLIVMFTFHGSVLTMQPAQRIRWGATEHDGK